MPTGSEPFEGLDNRPTVASVRQFMLDYQELNHLPPTLQEIADHFGSQWRSVAKHFVDQLVEIGWAEEILKPNQHRRVRALHQHEVVTEAEIPMVETHIVPITEIW